jgi:sulfite reductase (NADPH) flavoprotein alpha-component
VWSIFPDNTAVILSSTPQQAADFATIAYQATDTHIVHFFDHNSCREIGHTIVPIPFSKKPVLTLREAFKDAGYNFFEYHGSGAASIVVILQNGPLALQLKQVIKSGSSALGLVIVNVFRPWDTAAFQSAIPSGVSVVHVLDEVTDNVAQGALQVDVFSALLERSSQYRIHSHRLLSSQTHEFLSIGGVLLNFVQKITGVHLLESSTTQSKKLLMFGTSSSPLSALPHFLERRFTSIGGLQARLLEDHDFISKPGGVTASRLFISRNDVNFVPLSSLIPIGAPSEGHADFLAILDQNLLKTHSLLQHAKKTSTILVVSSWTAEEFLSNLPPTAMSLIRDRNIIVYLIDVQDVTRKTVGQDLLQDAVQNLLVELAVLRLYLGKFATEANVLQLASSSFGDVIDGIPLEKYNAHAWSSLRIVDIPSGDALDATPASSLKIFEPNAIVVETSDGGSVINGARLGGWHDAAKHLIFPSIFSPKTSDDNVAQTQILRPEVQDQTYLVTCTVNKRLTPIEYDRNVFHLEFDTSGTGLKYAIGEALGIHGWNDEQEVLDFCDWYGVDPQKLVTIPLPGDDTQMHTRTVFQALQQQIDVFGRPPKSFYTDLAEYATTQVDRYALQFIGSPEGPATFKKLSEKDTVTFCDVLKMYPSAKPGIERLCEMIGDIKPRHYSIASSQSVVGDRVDLLVVTVDWVTPSGQLCKGFLVSVAKILPRPHSLRTMYAIPCRTEGWSESHGLDQTQRNEGWSHLRHPANPICD